MHYRNIVIVLALAASSGALLLVQSPIAGLDYRRQHVLDSAQQSVQGPRPIPAEHSTAPPDARPERPCDTPDPSKPREHKGNLIHNGGFESPDVERGWKTYYSGEAAPEFVWIVEASNDADPESARVDLIDTFIRGVSEDGRPGAPDQCLNLDYLVVLHQDFATEVGKEYALFFRYARNPDGGDHAPRARVRVAGQKDQINEEFVHLLPCTFDDMRYESYQKIFVADAVRTRLEFADLSNNATGMVLDDIRVQSIPDSEPELPDATAGGKYVHLLRTILAPEDEWSYGRFRDYGNYSGTAYKRETNLPPGYWVYAKPYWYIWKARESGLPTEAKTSTNPLGQRVSVALVDGKSFEGILVEESPTVVVVASESMPSSMVRIERQHVQTTKWIRSDGAARDRPTGLKVTPIAPQAYQ